MKDVKIRNHAPKMLFINITLNHPSAAPNFLTALSGEEVERHKTFVALIFFTRKNSQKVGRGVK